MNKAMAHKEFLEFILVMLVMPEVKLRINIDRKGLFETCI